MFIIYFSIRSNPRRSRRVSIAIAFSDEAAMSIALMENDTWEQVCGANTA